MNFLTLKPETFGLDISDLSLRIVKLKKKRNYLRLASFGEAKIKPGIIQEGEIKDVEKLAEILKEAMKEVKGEPLRTRYAVVSLPEEKSFLQVIQMPKISREDLKSAVIYEAENYIPLPIEEVYLDSQAVESSARPLDHFDVLLAALPQKTVDPYLSSLKLAGLQPIVFEIESLAISRALIKNEITASPFLLLDFGATKTRFIVFSGQTVRFTSSISVSSQNFTEIISRNLGLSLAEAEKLKIKYGMEERVRLKIKKGISQRKKEEGEVFEALLPAMVDLIQQIKKRLDYYQTHVSHEHLLSAERGVSKVLLCGGGANLKGLPELLSLELKIPVELGNPWLNVIPEGKKELPKMPLEQSLGYVTALGLALRGLKGNREE